MPSANWRKRSFEGRRDGQANAYAAPEDSAARAIATEAIDAGFQRMVDPSLRLFFGLPFAHSEAIADQDRSVALSRDIGPSDLKRAEHHRDIIRRFGRFPHRNPILGRAMHAQEQRFLDEGGFAG
ncbi:DUF924 family protein [Mesorhizobium sp. M0659]|uniref:DUF924 family protein n=1 Tax=Mesorhizobium sp. M0659 TaxID=2956980 RepID=UPI00333C8F6A